MTDQNQKVQSKMEAQPATDQPAQDSIWDNDLPAGDSPPLPRWPLTAAIVAYCIWMGFLASMMIVRLMYP